MKKIIILIIIVILVSVVGGVVYYFLKISSEQKQSTTQSIQTPRFRTYRNIEWGFEFQYSENWSFHENTFYSPFSKFNLVGASPEEKGHPNPIASPLLINIVTPDFADRAMMSKKNLGATTTDFAAGEIQGKKYEYVFESVLKISIDLPFGDYRLLLVADKEYEDVFNQIIASFKFLK